MKGSWLFRGLLVAALLLTAVAPAPSGSGSLAIRPAAAAVELAPIVTEADALVAVLLQGDFKKATSILNHLHRSFRQLSKQLEREKEYNERKQRELAVMHMWVREIDLAIRNQSKIGGAIAANQLTAALIRYRNFPDKLQAAGAWFAYLAREVELLNMEDAEDNASLLELRRSDASATWQKLRAVLLKDLRNKTLVMNVDNTLTRLNVNDAMGVAQIKDARRLQELVAQVRGVLPVPDGK